MDESKHFSLITDFDIHLFRSGKHYRLHDKLGSHLCENDGVKGCFFAVWAPSASSVSVIASFNGWNAASHPMKVRWDSSGIWELFIPGVQQTDIYKYRIVNADSGESFDKSDPFAIHWETPPKTGSIVWDPQYEWQDKKWMEKRAQRAHNEPCSVYEVHLGSWRRNPEQGNRSLSYRELAGELTPYLKELGFTHVEFLPVMEHPFFGSWGYQSTGYFAPSSRFGTPEDFMFLVDTLHDAGIGVILDWVPSHFPTDGFGLAYFDGTHLYEHADPQKGFHPDWKSYIFNYGRYEVVSFLISSASYWMDRYHADGLRVDAVASMLYLDYSRKQGEWVPNHFGGNENLEAIAFLKDMNSVLYQDYPGIMTIAEESTAWPGVSRPVFEGGLGFGMKWMMGWMHDTLAYFSEDSIHRKYHHNQLTFSIIYAFTENFMLPLSHDEVVHGKGSLINKMPGDEWQRFANLRLLYTYMFTHPGTKLMFMGGEIAQYEEWNHESSLHWHLLDFAPHKGVHKIMSDLNHLYKSEPALWEKSFESSGFEWLVGDDYENSVIAYKRKGEDPKDDLIVIGNFTPVPRDKYSIGVETKSGWKEIFNSDRKEYWGSGSMNKKVLKTVAQPKHGKDLSIEVNLPPLAMVILKAN